MSHIVAIIGSGVSGAEAAYRLSAKGIKCVVFEQNILPYGKLESGLPKWHVNLRNMHEAKIDKKLDHPLITFVPGARLGENLSFNELVNEMNFSAILLATGAWRDRPLPIQGIDSFTGKGFYYQNFFVAWYNRSHEPDYKSRQLKLTDNAIVIGGGLASLDVVKILMIETVRKALQTRKIDIDIFSLEMRGIHDILKEHGLRFEELNVQPCTLFYRRSADEMPLSPTPVKDSDEARSKTRLVRRKLLNNLLAKFPFRFIDNAVPVDFLTKNDQLSGLVFRKTISENDGVKEIPNSEFEVICSLAISAVGSIPEAFPGLQMKNNSFNIVDSSTGELMGFPNVFVIGNAVTGRGNIRESQIHGRKVAEYIHDQYLAMGNKDYEELFRLAGKDVNKKIQGIEKKIKNQPEPNKKQLTVINDRIKQFWKKSGYQGLYKEWVREHRPIRVEDI